MLNSAAKLAAAVSAGASVDGSGIGGAAVLGPASEAGASVTAGRPLSNTPLSRRASAAESVVGMCLSARAAAATVWGDVAVVGPRTPPRQHGDEV